MNWKKLLIELLRLLLALLAGAGGGEFLHLVNS